MDLQIKKSTPLHGLNLLFSIHYLKTIIMRKLLFLSLLLSVFIMHDACAQIYYTIPFSNEPLPISRKSLDINVRDKETGGHLKASEVVIYVHTKRGKILLTTVNQHSSYLYRTQEMKEEIVEDTMIFEVKARGYRGGKFYFYSSIHLKSGSTIVIPLPKEDYYPNQIEVIGDRVEVIINRQSEFYDLKEFRQSEDEDVLTTLCRLPGFEVGKKEIKMKGEILRQFYINGENYNGHFWEYSTTPEFFKRLNQSLKKLKK